MLVACRLAGLSALEVYYAGVRAHAQGCGAGGQTRRQARAHSGPQEAAEGGRRASGKGAARPRRAREGVRARLPDPAGPRMR
jgi:hypothetical protein